MTHKKGHRHPAAPKVKPPAASSSKGPKLEVVLKSDTVGTLAAARTGLDEVEAGAVKVEVIQGGVGAVAKSDITMALTGSRLVLGFGVGVLPKVEDVAKGQGVELRLYDVIYHLTRDVEQIARSLTPSVPQEKITGKAKVIAIFKSTRKGIILGCEVAAGTLALGKRFRVITAMGPAYHGTVESLHIEADAVKEAKKGQQVGLKILGFKGAKIGDLGCKRDRSQRFSMGVDPSGVTDAMGLSMRWDFRSRASSGRSSFRGSWVARRISGTALS
jgi:translation initiation factor IF-2